MRQAIVLCGGRGERLRSVVDDRPKVLATVNGVAFLGFVLERLVDAGMQRIVLSTGYLASMIADYVEARGDWGAELICIEESAPLGTGGALLYAAHRAGIDGPFLALNGDTWFDGDLASLDRCHQASGFSATLSLCAVEDASRYGAVVFDEDEQRVLEFREKDAGVGAAWINAGQYMLETKIFAGRSPGQSFSLERDVLPGQIAAGVGVVAYDHANFLDIGTPEDYARAAQLFDHEA